MCTAIYLDKKNQVELRLRTSTQLRKKMSMSKYHWEYMYQLNDILMECNVVHVSIGI